MITLPQLQAIMPAAGRRAAVHLDACNSAMSLCHINNAKRMLSFLAECGHESADLLYMAEVWGPDQVPVQRTYRTRMGNDKPQAIAIAHANGDPDPGHYFRGYGPIQTTGFDNLSAAADAFGVPRQRMVIWFQQEGAWAASAFYWQKHGLNELADTDNLDEVADEFDAVSDLINFGHRTPRLGDTNGWADRLAHYRRARSVLLPGIPMPLLKGATGPDVALLQRALSAVGILVPDDGDFGERTDAAVRRFQGSRHLVQDGVVGVATWTALGVRV